MDVTPILLDAEPVRVEPALEAPDLGGGANIEPVGANPNIEPVGANPNVEPADPTWDLVVDLGAKA